ncbi:MAG: chromate transporter [Bacilli bacterium]
MQDNKLKNAFLLFITFFKIGLFTFGGGIAMIPLIQNEVVEKKKWMRAGEILDVITISESTPGPIAINSATYVGYKVCGVLGSIFATLGVIIPSFTIIFIISLFYEQFIKIAFINNIFKGLKVGVIFLLIQAIISLSKGVKKNIFSLILFVLALTINILFTVFNIPFSSLSIVLIACGLVIGVVKEVINDVNGKKGKTK